MKRITCLFVAMVAIFLSAWAYKFSQPLNPSDAYANGADLQDGAWWNLGANVDGTVIADSNWRLDPEIPENYIPVLGADELYMVVDEGGNIVKYRKRTRQEDGTWVWEDVNPDIPEHYEKVEGLENVYRILEADGTVRYVKYVRNDDDTFYFVDVDENGNPIRSIIPEGGDIPENFVRITGNIYAVYNEHGVIIGYVERIQNPDGTYNWVEVDKPDIPVSQPVKISEELNPSSSQALENETPQVSSQPGSTGYGTPGPIYIIVDENKSATKTEPKSDGGYIETETYTETKVSGDYTIIYETTITRIYDSAGNLVSTKKDGPNEIGRHGVGVTSETSSPNPNRIESTIGGEYVRVTNGLRFNTTLADSVLAELNAERASENLPPLSMADGELYQAACIKAADMAIYNHSDYDSPMYGTLDTMLVMFGIQAESPSETLWKTSGKSAAQIHARFQAQSGSYASRMSSLYSEVAIAIVEKSGYQYIVEIFN